MVISLTYTDCLIIVNGVRRALWPLSFCLVHFPSSNKLFVGYCSVKPIKLIMGIQFKSIIRIHDCLITSQFANKMEHELQTQCSELVNKMMSVTCYCPFGTPVLYLIALSFAITLIFEPLFNVHQTLRY